MSDSPQPPGEPSARSTTTIRAEFDWTVTSPSIAVVETLSVVTNRQPTAFRPLYHGADPDALDALLDRDNNPDDGSTVEVSFTHEAHDVTVTSDGTVTVAPHL